MSENMSACEFDISLVRPAELAQVADLVERYWSLENIAGFSRDSVYAQLQRLAGQPHLGAALVALAEGNLIGYILIVYVFSLEHLGLTAEVDELYVEPAYRSRGVGSALLTMAERVAVDAGCTNISLQLSTGNERAEAVYRRNGFAKRNGYELLEKDIGNG